MDNKASFNPTKRELWSLHPLLTGFRKVMCDVIQLIELHRAADEWIHGTVMCHWQYKLGSINHILMPAQVWPKIRVLTMLLSIKISVEKYMTKVLSLMTDASMHSTRRIPEKQKNKARLTMTC